MFHLVPLVDQLSLLHSFDHWWLKRRAVKLRDEFEVKSPLCDPCRNSMFNIRNGWDGFQSSLTKNHVFTIRLIQQKQRLHSIASAASLLSPACGVLCLADILTSKKCSYATLANSLLSRPRFILNWGVKVAMLLFSLSLFLTYHSFCKANTNVLALP